MLFGQSEEMSDTICELFIKFFNSGDIPNDWKLDIVTAISKKGRFSSHVMRDNIIRHPEKHKPIRESHHGFVKNKSCLKFISAHGRNYKLS